MAKDTVLSIVQDVLNDMKSDNVNSITDTPEAYTIAQMVRSTYFDLINEKVWPTAKELLKLTASGDSTKPTKMTIPDAVSEVEWIKYNVKTSVTNPDNFKTIKYLKPDEFIELCNGRDSTATTITSVAEDTSGIGLLVYNDRAPTYWTSFDDEVIYFDAYNSTLDSTLQSSKSQAYVVKEPTFTLSDSHVPDMPAKAFTLLKNEVKSMAFEHIKQSPNNTANRRGRRQKTTLARKKWRTNGGTYIPNYGRK